MSKYVLIFVAVVTFVTMASAFAFEPPLKIDPKEQKIEKRLDDKLRSIKPGEKIKIWVYLTDKEIFDEASLKKSVSEVRAKFTPRAVERRANRAAMGDSYDFYDIPVSTRYMETLESTGMEIKRKSRWLNAVSGYADKKTIDKISEFSFVAEIKEVPVGRRKPVPDIKPEEGNIPPGMNKTYSGIPDSVVDWYGMAFVQLNIINVPLMHQLGFTGDGVMIALFDTGFKLSHPAFDNTSILNQYDFINDDDDVTDELPTSSQLSHGTAVLSVIAARDDSLLIGSAYNADYIVAKTEVVTEEYLIEEDNWVAAAEWADLLGADIISSSVAYFDWYTYTDLDGATAEITVAAEIAASRGITVVNSAGNERDKDFFWITPPADGEHVIAVGSVTSAGLITTYSSSGPTYDGRIKPDVVAMGSGIYRAIYNTDSYSGGGSGTSYSAPLTAGAAALLLEVYPDWTPDDVMQALKESADRYENPDTLYGYGLYDTYKAAQLMDFEPIPPVLLAVGDSLNMTVSVSGYEDTSGVTVITAANLPVTAEFIDNGDRTATLKYSGKADDIGSRVVTFSAVSGDAAVSEDVSFTVTAQRNLAAGPNPFDDSLTIFLGAGSGEVEEISVYSTNGEKVWDNFSDTYNRETGTVVWRGVNNSGARVTSGVYLVYVRTVSVTEKFKVFKE